MCVYSHWARCVCEPISQIIFAFAFLYYGGSEIRIASVLSRMSVGLCLCLRLHKAEGGKQVGLAKLPIASVAQHKPTHRLARKASKVKQRYARTSNKLFIIQSTLSLLTDAVSFVIGCVCAASREDPGV